MDHTWLALVIVSLILGWMASLLAVRWWATRRLLPRLLEEALGPELHSVPPPEQTPEDRRAHDLIAGYKRRYLFNLWPDTEFNVRRIVDLALELIQDVARVYYPDEERPELKASLADLMELYARIGERLQGLLHTLPLRALKDVEIQTVLRCHQLYQQYQEHPVRLFLQRHHLTKAARWAWMVKNYANPWYWGYRAAYAGSREVLSRFFLARAAAIIGEEAVRLYGRQTQGSPHLSRYRLIVAEMVHIYSDQGQLAAAAYASLLRFILGARGLRDRDKLALLHLVSDSPAVARPDPDTLPPRERKLIRRILTHQVKTHYTGAERSGYLALITQRWGH